MTEMLSDWQLKHVAPGSIAAEEIAFGRGEDWIPVSAPGDAYLALVEAGQLAHPFFGRNEAAAGWVRDREFWWHTHLAVDTAAQDETVELVFEGLDTFADIFIDGAQIGASDNMFRTLRLDVTSLAGTGRHDLAVRFHPISAMVAGRDVPNWRMFKIFNDEGRTLVRKAQYGWGWDWGPNLPTTGIWKPVRIERRRAVAVAGVAFTTLTLTNDAATVEVGIDLTAFGPVEIELRDPDGTIVASDMREGSGSLKLTVPKPRLWWTADLGDQPLYTLIAHVAGAPDHIRKVGIRTIAVDRSPDPDEPDATFFRFVLNGVPIFARGACWIPASSFIGAVPVGTHADLIARAAAANMNMLRVWGGGIYEDDAFYDACDAAGLLVWQDFMFACAPYPEDEAFIANVRAEAAEQVRRLRAHPCLALWCGNNEIQLLQAFDNHIHKTDDRLVGLSIFDEHIPAVLAELDPATPYWPSSPWGGANPNAMRHGDVHDWTVWHGAAPVTNDTPDGPIVRTDAKGMHYTRYAEDEARFVSEFGIHGAPALATLKRWMAPEDLSLDAEGFAERNKDHGDKASKMASLLTGRPRSIEEYVDAIALLQAEGLAFGVEHFRRRKPHCSGALIWQLNDCWPCVSWSLIDYDGIAKAGYFAVRRAFAPVLASLRRGDGNVVELWIINDSLAPVEGFAHLTLVRLHGGEDRREDVAFEIGANASVMVWQGKMAPDLGQILTVRGDHFPPNRLLPAPIKDMDLAPDPGLTCHVEGNRLTVTASFYALAVRAETDDPAVRFDDNHFDLAGGESRTIIADRPLARASIRVSSWADRRASRIGLEVAA